MAGNPIAATEKLKELMAKAQGQAAPPPPAGSVPPPASGGGTMPPGMRSVAF